MAINATRQLPRLLAVIWLTMLNCIPLGIVPAAADSSQERKGVMIQVSDVVFEESDHHGQFTYTREFHDINGHGAILRYGRVCFGSGGCISAPVKYFIEPGGVLKQERQLLIPMANSQTFNFTYTGENGEGDDITVKVRIFVAGDHLELQEVE